MKRSLIAIFIAAFLFAAPPRRANAQTAPQAPATGAVPAAPTANTDDVDIHFSDGRQYVGDAVVEPPKAIVVGPADKATTTFVNGKPPRGPYIVVPDGPGKITYASGATLQATFLNGVPNGAGDYQAPGGFSFKGDFADGQPVSGVATYPDGSSYSGAFAKGLPSGQGVWTTTGRVLRAEGTWSDGALVNGTVTFRDGTRYAGALDAAGKVNGPARFELPDGSILTGTFVDGNYSGRFVERFAPAAENSRAYRLLLTVDVTPPGPTLSGKARLTFADGSTVFGNVRDDSFAGPGAFIYRDGTAFHGSFTDGRLEGPVIWTNGRGTTIAGVIRHGRLEGRAVLTTSHGKKLHGLISEEGNFFTFTGPVDALNRPNGTGVYGYIDGETLTGRWIHGKLIGPVVDREPGGSTFYVTVLAPSRDLAGPARIVLPNGNVARGVLERDGYLHGAGSLAIAGSGDVLHGDWIDGTLHSSP
jgi:hypothetical protein